MTFKNREVFFSFDIEADGLYPGDYSMLSIGMVACASREGHSFTRLDIDDERNQFYRTMMPITRNFNRDSVEICKQGGVDRDELLISGIHPVTVLLNLSDWVRNVAGEDRPVAVAYPLGFDWAFLYYYFCKFASERNPFGFSGCLDIKTMYSTKADALVINSTKRNMPKMLRSKRLHTHNALDDAIEQAELFCNIMEWKP